MATEMDIVSGVLYVNFTQKTAVYSLSPGNDGWNPGTGTDNYLISGSDLTAITSGSSVILNINGATALAPIGNALSVGSNGFNASCKNTGAASGATLTIGVINP